MVMYIGSIGPLWHGVVVYSVRWDVCFDVDVCIVCKWNFWWCPIIVIDCEYGVCLCIFFGGHPSPVDGF